MRGGTESQERVGGYPSAQYGNCVIPQYLREAEIGLPGFVICWFAGQLNYGNAEYFMIHVLSFLTESGTPIRWLVLQCNLIDNLDCVAARMLMASADRIKTTKAGFVLMNVSPETQQFLRDCEAFEIFKPCKAFTSTELEAAVKIGKTHQLWLVIEAYRS